jgi:hypothetical protein
MIGDFSVGYPSGLDTAAAITPPTSLDDSKGELDQPPVRDVHLLSHLPPLDWKIEGSFERRGRIDLDFWKDGGNRGKLDRAIITSITSEANKYTTNPPPEKSSQVIILGFIPI